MAVAALTLAMTGAAAVPAAALADTQGIKLKVKLTDTRLKAKVGARFAVRGRAAPVTGRTRMALQIRTRRGWRTLDRGRTRADGRFWLGRRVHVPTSAAARVVARPGTRRAQRRHAGRLEAYRVAIASWYGPGLYGNRTGCGGRLGYSSLGVAHKSLPCGTRVTFRHRGRTVRVPVIDRGPYVGGREYDLTAATARRLGFQGHGAILATR
jgi:rare lipoprotein A (peptidoglycan hydrolase)